MDPKAHWETVYRTKRPHELSWFQAEARVSLALIERAVPDRAARVIDVGGGASTLVEGLIAAGYRDLTVLDLSASALSAARARAAAAAGHVTWIEADVLSTTLPPAAFDVWHDRAVFHFLTSPDDRRRYVEQVRRAMKPGGFVIVATFAEDGPTQCQVATASGIAAA